ncbi:hypothetical protein ANN_01749 [Periplaneta americana]|uniref:Uncharacterized protein n=1 Tax=Periplaneta americana TaxID=6978 RepID=A0ABQ8TUF0_PERAM|nr:hypothetical protein ANN_01749 [Periplaneta americana]
MNAGDFNRQRCSFDEDRRRQTIALPEKRTTVSSGRTQDNNRCRRCHCEVETLAHVLGSCRFGETLRNSRHHKIRSVIATCLKSNGYTTYEEVQGIADTGSHRRIDIITFKPGETKDYILDPTIRFETHQNQLEEVNLEKSTIYEPTIPYYKTSYKLRDIDVIGSMIRNFLIEILPHPRIERSDIINLVLSC